MYKQKAIELFEVIGNFAEVLLKKLNLKDHKIENISVCDEGFSFFANSPEDDLWYGKHYKFSLDVLDEQWNKVCENYKKEQAARKKALAQEKKEIAELRKNPEVKKYLKLMNEI